MDGIANYFFLPQKTQDNASKQLLVNEANNTPSSNESDVSKSSPPTASLLERFAGSQFVKDAASVIGCSGAALAGLGFMGGAVVAMPAAPVLALMIILDKAAGKEVEVGPYLFITGICAATFGAPLIALGAGLVWASRVLYEQSVSISHPGRDNSLEDMLTFRRCPDEQIVINPDDFAPSASR